MKKGQLLNGRRYLQMIYLIRVNIKIYKKNSYSSLKNKQTMDRGPEWVFSKEAILSESDRQKA